MEKEKQDVIQEKTTLKEKISLKFRKNWVVNKTVTILLVLILFAAYICINLWTQSLELPEIDVTENKIYTLSDTTKEAIGKIEEDVTIYAYGFEEDGNLIKLLKQYGEANSKIKYEVINEENNYNMVQEYDLKSGYYILIIKSGESEKVIDGSTEFSTYDYTTYQSVDVTEQTITNSILALSVENKPKVYFLQGHQEFKAEEMQVLTSYLQNEAFEVNYLNLITTGSVPDDCNILAIMSPTTDFIEQETQAIKDYINKGGNIYFSMDTVSESTELPNIKQILDEYGVSVDNGYILEYAENQSMSNAPFVFMPQISSTSEITQDIYTDSYMWLVYSARLKYKDDSELESMNVSKETLLSSSEESIFISDLNSELSSAISTGEKGQSEIGSLLTKAITTTNEAGEEVTTNSKMVLVASGSFVSDYKIEQVSQNYPLSYLGSNKDFTINAMSYLGDKGNSLTIRKDMANSTYLPTETENKVVIMITFFVPILIIIIGVVVGIYRKKRK